MKGRLHIEERLDTGRENGVEVRRSLADLRNINAFLGGQKVLRRLLDAQVARTGSDRFSVLDVASGAADLPLAIAHWYPRARVTALELQFRHIRYSLDWLATHQQPAAARVEFVCADVFSPPFADRPFDFVTASLFVHHFTDGDLPRILHGLGRLARHAVIVNELDRNRLPWLFARVAGRLIWRSPITHHDAPASIRRAFSRGELGHAAAAAGFTRFNERWHWPFRRSLVIELEP